MAPLTIDHGDPSVERLATWIRRGAVLALVAAVTALRAGWVMPLG